MQHVTHVIKRVGVRDESTVAIVQYDIDIKGVRRFLDKNDEFFALLMRVVTRWCKNTPAGRTMWETTAHDFNISDLALDYQWIHPILLNSGICNFDIQVFTGEDSSWYFDTVLFNRFESICKRKTSKKR